MTKLIAGVVRMVHGREAAVPGLEELILASVVRSGRSVPEGAGLQEFRTA